MILLDICSEYRAQSSISFSIWALMRLSFQNLELCDAPQSHRYLKTK